jgi:hypothetical protein
MEGEFDGFWHVQAESSGTEAIGFQRACPGQDGVAYGLDFRYLPLVHLVGREEVRLDMHVLSIVPAHEGVHVGSSLLRGSEILGERRPSLEGREQGFDEGVVVAYVSAARGVADHPGRTHR